MSAKPCFVLIRGLLRDARHWGAFTGVLRKQFPEADIWVPDIPGNGRRYHETSPDSIEKMTEALRQQLEHRKNLNLIALSMGGMVAIDWMTRYPDDIASAVLINTSVRPLSPFYQRLRWQIYPGIIKMLCQSEMQREHTILALTSNYYRNNKDILNSWQRWQQQQPVSALSGRNQLLAAATFKISQKPKQPILIVTSSADRLVDYRCSKRLQQLWLTDYQQHDKAGHDLPLDDPDWLAAFIRDWLIKP